MSSVIVKEIEYEDGNDMSFWDCIIIAAIVFIIIEFIL